MKQILLPVFCLLLVFAGSTVKAQSGDTKITTGVVAYNGQDYKKAIEALTVGLDKAESLKEKNRPKGFYYRGKSRLNYMRQLGQKMAAAGQDVDPTTVLKEEEISFMETALLGAYEDFKMARKWDDGKWGKKVDAEMLMMGGMILQGGATMLNGSFDDKLSPEEKMEAYKETIKYMDIAAEINPEGHLPYDLRGQAYLSLKDSAKAYESFSRAGEIFAEHEPTNPDQVIAYVYYRKALLDRYFKKDLDASLKAIEDGKVVLDKEHNRILDKKDKYQPNQIESLNEQYESIKGDLTRFELDLFLNFPDKLEEAVGKFDLAIVDEPKNYILHVAYAQLLEKLDPDKAVEIYKKATEIDPGKQIAFFNLGALYVNKGVEKYKQANDISDDFEKAKALQAAGDADYESALPYLEKALEAQPCDMQSINALIQICINLSASDEGYNDKYKKYKDMKAECSK